MEKYKDHKLRLFNKEAEHKLLNLKKLNKVK